jgi:uncharacterized membrane protein YkgB
MAMVAMGREKWTDEERDEIYDLVDQLPSLYFGYDGDEWEATIERLHEMITKKREELAQNGNGE